MPMRTAQDAHNITANAGTTFVSETPESTLSTCSDGLCASVTLPAHCSVAVSPLQECYMVSEAKNEASTIPGIQDVI
jgi:hypothetical protein